ncbi:MAG: nucleotidyl transferase AbiEii/AbiGii toxin family protein [Phycisphaerae bacterium]|nr:nucleotidyl transferase AbiEii/AbiGii toxin family protein [Phycisphaerae bacterium]
MTDRNAKNTAASIHQRLLNAAKQAGRPFNELLQYYAIERFLFRLSQSAYADRFFLKGALTLLVLRIPVTRPTRDIDLLGRIDNDLEAVRTAIAKICDQEVEPDGLVFDSASVTTERITEDADYHGVRAKFRGNLGNARIAMQIDIGFSDVMTPGPVKVSYPTILDQPRPQLNAYNRETVIAEKFEAMVKLGMLNSRMKDFFDVWALSQNFDFDGRELAEAIQKTFARRETAVVANSVCFTAEFVADPSKSAQWNAFLRNGRLTDTPTRFAEIIESVRGFLQPVAEKLAANEAFIGKWSPGGPWHNGQR